MQVVVIVLFNISYFRSDSVLDRNSSGNNGVLYMNREESSSRASSFSTSGMFSTG